jgi:Kelch motif protein
VKGEWQVVPDEAADEDPHKSRSADLRRVGGLTVAILIVAASTTSTSPYRSSTALCGVSRPTGAMTLARAGHTATLLPSGKVLVAGGWVDSPEPTVSAELYDPTTGRWTVTGSMKAGRASHAAALLRSGKVLVTGGDAPGEGGAQGSGPPYEAIASAEVYDPLSGIWTETSSMLVAGDSVTAIVLESGKVFVAPGRFERRFEPDVVTTPAELYDPVTESWSAIGGLIQRGGSATLLASGEILVVSGDSRGPQLYDPATGAWRRTGVMTARREGHTAALLASGKVLVVGGISNTTSAEIYDPATDRWTLTGPMTASHGEGASATLLRLSRVLVAGGGPPGPAGNSVDLYDPATARWTALEAMAASRIFFTGTLLPSGTLLLAGGFDGGAAHLLSSAEIYAPACISR